MARKPTQQELEILRQQALRAGVDPKLVDQQMSSLGAKSKPGFIGSLINQAMGLPRLAGEAIFQGARTLTDPAFRKASTGGQLTPQEAEHILRQKPTQFVEMEEIKDVPSILETSARRTAGTGSFFIPGGKTVKGAMALGATAGGLSAFGAGGGVKEIGKGMALGGALGGVTKWATGKLAERTATKARQAKLREGLLAGEAGETARKTTKLGKTSRALERGAIKPELGSGKGMFAKSRSERALNHLDEAMQEFGDKLGIKKGGPGTTLDNLEMLHKQYGKKVQDILKTAPDIPFKELDERLMEAMGDFIDENGELIFDSPSTIKIIQNDLRKLHKLIQADDTVNAQSLNTFKTQIQDKINKVFRAAKGDTVAQLTEKEEARYAMREAIDEIIKKFIPEAKNNTFIQSSLNDLSTGAWKQYTTSQRIPLVGLQSRGLQQGLLNANAKGARFFNWVDDANQWVGKTKAGAKGAVGAAAREGVEEISKRAPNYGKFHKWAVSYPPATKMEYAGRIAAGELSKPDYQPGDLPQQRLGQADVDALGGLGGEAKSQDEIELEQDVQSKLEQGMSADGLWQWNGIGWLPTKEHIQLMYIKDFNSTGGKNFAKISKMGEIISPAEGDLDENSKKKLRLIGTADGLVDQLDGLLTEMGTHDWALTARGAGLMRKIGIPLGINSPKQLVFENLRNGIVAQIARAMSEVGNLSTYEQENALALLPSQNMSTAEVAEQIKQVKNSLNISRQRLLSGADYEASGTELGIPGMMDLENLSPTGGLPMTPGITP